MPTYLYCLIAADAAVDPGATLGIDGAPVRVIGDGLVRAIVSDVGERTVAPNAGRARAHDEIVRLAMRGATPLPARFGQTFPTDRAALESIAEREADLSRALASVAGCVEMTLRLPLRVSAPSESNEPRVDGGAGRRYLLALQARERLEHDMQLEAQLARDRVGRQVAGLIREERWEVTAIGTSTLVLSHLLLRSAVSDYRAAVTSPGFLESVAGMMVSGPWAPYSFVTPIEGGTGVDH